MGRFKNKNKSNSSKYFKAKKQSDFSWGRFFKKMLFWFLFLAFWAICGWVLFFSNYTKIQEIKIVSEKIDKHNLQEISNDLMNEQWFGYLPKDNFFLFPRKILVKKIKNDFKIVREVEFKNKFPDKIIVEIEEREEIIVWCGREECWLLDETGTLFYLLQPGEKEEKFEKYQIIIDESYSGIEGEQKIESEGLIEFVKKTRKEIENRIGLKIEREIKTPTLISREIRLKVEDEGWQIYLNLDEDIDSQVALLKEVLESSINPGERKKLNYIDLRIPGKAIYNSSGKLNEDEN